MKKYITVLVCFCLAYTAYSQEAKEEMKAYMDDGVVKWSSRNNDVSFRVGGRFAVDGAYYFDDITDRASGMVFNEARVRMFSTFARDFDAKFDVDFAYNKIALKDVYVRWHVGPNGFLRLGNYAEPFSADNIQSNFETRFIGKSSTIEALGTGRAVGISYRHFTDVFWGEGGFFSQQLSDQYHQGDMGWSVSARVLLRTAKTRSRAFHIGGSVNYRRPNANGFESGKDDYNRYSTFTSRIGSTVDRTDFLNAVVPNASHTLKYGAEIIGVYDRFYIQSEYIGTKAYRKKDWDYLFEQQLGGMWSFHDMQSFKDWYGEARTLSFQGCYAQVGFMLMGPNYKYNRVEGMLDRTGRGALELLLRYNYTSLNDVDGEWFDGAFYTDKATGQPNNSIGGGKVNTYTVGLNYSLTRNLIFKLNYNFINLDSYNYMDNKMSTIVGRIHFEF